MDNKRHRSFRGLQRPKSSAAVLMAALLSAGSLFVAERARAEPLCDEPPSATGIGPHDSTPSQYSGGAAPLAVDGQWNWTGPCGTTTRTNGAWGANWDHFYLDVVERAELIVTIAPDDPADLFELLLYRGRVGPGGSQAFQPKCPQTTSEGTCTLAGSTTSLGSIQRGGLQRVQVAVAPGIYTVQVNYAAVVEGSYRGVASAGIDTSDPGTTPEDPLEPPDEPAVRGTYPEYPNDPLFKSQWGMTTIKAPQAWPLATGFGINIGVVDTGLDLEHPDLACPGKVRRLPGANQVEGGAPQDDDGHGTHVAGIAAACTNNGEGVVGVAPDATLMPIRVEVDNLANFVPTAAALDQVMADGINLATKHGAHVINLSLGPFVPPDVWQPDRHRETEDALEAARDAGVVVVAAAGNFYRSSPSPFCGYPALSEHVICVGATDRNDNVTYYSYLPNKPDDSGGLDSRSSVVAPGGSGLPVCSKSVQEGIISTDTATAEDENCRHDDAAPYAEMDGTSQAAPHAAGVAALVYDRLGGERTETNRDSVVKAILESARDLYTEGPDPVSGRGLLDAAAAVSSVTPVVTMRASALALYVDGPGSSRSSLVATLTDGGSGAALPEQPIEFFGDDTSLGWATTDESGIASIPLEGRFRGAGHYFEAVFAGNEQYQRSSGSTQT